MHRLVAPIVVAASLVGCGADPAAEPATTDAANEEPTASTTTASTTTTATATTTTTTEAPVTNSSIPTSAVKQAIDDLAGRLGVDPATIEVVSAEEVTWRDGSLGCPEPGMNYTQALVNGQRIVLAAGGEEYAYHAGRSGDPFHCPAERAQDPATDPNV